MSNTTTNTSTTVTEPIVVDRSKFKLDVLNIIKTLQIQYGLRLSNYESYRHYCTRRITKLRKQIRKQYGKKSYQSKITNITQQINDNRYLFITLLKAERAWSYAMDLKKSFELGEKRAGFHINRRYAKAAKHATELEAFCQELSDPYTIIETKAYASWHRATILMNREQWQQALEEITISKTIYEGLAKTGNSSLKDLYLQRCAESGPVIRFCDYNLKNLDNPKSESTLNSSIDSVQKSLTELSKSKQETNINITSTTISWRSKSIQVENEKLKEKLSIFEQYKKENESNLPSNIKSVNVNETKKYMPIYDKLVFHLNSCEIILNNDISNVVRINAKSKTFKSEIEEENLKSLLSYILYQKMKYLYDRNQIIIMMFKKSIEGEAFDVKALKGKKKISQKDLVRMSTHQVKIYTSLIENQDATNIHITQSRDNESQLLLLKSLRLYYISMVTISEKKFQVAMSIMDRIQSNIATIKKQSPKNTSIMQETNDLESFIKLQRSKIHASSFIEQLSSNEELKNQMSSLSLSQDGSADKPKDLISGIDSFDSSFVEEKKLVDFPPQLEPIPVKPLFFDLAFNGVQFPNLEQRKKPTGKGGLFGSFWGR